MCPQLPPNPGITFKMVILTFDIPENIIFAQNRKRALKFCLIFLRGASGAEPLALKLHFIEYNFDT